MQTSHMYQGQILLVLNCNIHCFCALFDLDDENDKDFFFAISENCHSMSI